MGSIGIVEQLVALERCDRCGLERSGLHPGALCDATMERRELWADGWVDLAALWPSATTTEGAGWAETRTGPGYRPVYDGLGLADVVVRRTAWVRHEDPCLTGLAAAACVGLHAIRPDRSVQRVTRQVLAMGSGGMRSLARPQGFEIPVGCGGQQHRLAVVDGRLVSEEHRELQGKRRPKHRGAVHRIRWLQSLETTPVPLLLDGVPVAAGPDGASCHEVAAAWAAGLYRTMTFDVTGDHGTWVTPRELAATISAGVVLQRTARARLLLDLVDATGGDIAADVEMALLPPGAEVSIGRHHRLSAVRMHVSADA